MKKVLGLVLSLIMCFSALSVFAFADETTDNETIDNETTESVIVAGDDLNNALYKCPGPATAEFDEENKIYTVIGKEDVQNATQIYFNLPSTVKGSEYPYMVIKYRYDQSYAKAGISVFRSEFKAIDINHDNAEVTVSNRTKDGDIATVADGEWQVAVIDMRSVSFEATRVGLPDGSDRQYLTTIEGKTWSDFEYNKIGLVPYGWNTYADSQFDLEYFGFFKTEDEARMYVSGTTGVILSGSSLKNAMYKFSSGAATAEFDEENKIYTVIGKENVQNATQIYFNLPSTVKGSEYPYMVIKYRYDQSYAKAGISVFRSEFKAIDVNHDNAEVTVSNRTKDGDIATVADGEWQVAVIDMRSVSFEATRVGLPDGSDRQYLTTIEGKTWSNFEYNKIGLVPYGWNSYADSQFDLEYFGFFKTEEEAKAFVGIPVYEDTATGYTYDAARLDLVYKINASDSINSTVVANDDKSYVTFTSNQTSGAKASRMYIPLDDSFDVATQKYFAIKYRYNNNKLLADMQLMRSIKSNEANPLSRVKDGSFTIVTDGDGWQTLVVDLTEVEWDNDLFVGKTWDQHELNGIYLMPWGGAPTNGATVDIEVLGFSDTENNARAIVGLEPVSDDKPSDEGDNNKQDNNQETEVPDSSTPTESVDTTADASTEAPEEEKKGCGSYLGFSGVLFALALVAATATHSKKKDHDC